LSSHYSSADLVDTAWLSETNLGSQNFFFVRNPELG
jgi:hypothetical protein